MNGITLIPAPIIEQIPFAVRASRPISRRSAGRFVVVAVVRAPLPWG